MESKDIQNSILKAVDTIATRRISQLELDKTITAIIKNNVGIVNRRKIYRVQYDGGFFNATAQNEGDAYLPGMAVYVSIPQGNFSNEKFIIGRANSFATNEQVSAVAALANNYGIVGANNIKGSSTQSFGVHSYHNPKEEESAPEKIAHRYNLLYKYGEDDSSLSTNPIDAKLYAKDTNAIMFRADFMNILSSEQKAKVSGEFGVVFNLAFKNKAYEIGETQGEILDHYADIIQAEIPIVGTQIALNEEDENNKVIIDTDNETALVSLKMYIESIVSIINQEDERYFENAIALDSGSLDQTANNILILVGKFAKENPAAYDDIAESIVNAYVTLIEDLRTVCKSFEEMQAEYEIWRETKIKEPEEKIVSYYLSSNSMIGNPFHFSSWISQYEVFEIDLESFLRLDSIILYKEGFIQDASKEANWPLPTPIQEEKGIQQAGPDIFVRNLQMYFMKPLTDYDGTYQLKVESPKQGFIFYGDEAEDYEIKLTATVFRELYEDLSRNQNTKFYWFKSDGNIVSPNQSEYSPYGGLGWAEIPNNNSYKIKIGADSCPAYENYFRCVAVYTGEETPIILRYDVVLYNMKGQQFALESDLGDHFGFDAGNPVLTLKTRTDQEAEFEEIVDSENQFKFYWYLITNNAQKVFLLENTTTVDYTDINIANFAQNKAQAKLLNNIEFYQGENKLSKKENYSKATRIKYPMSNAGDASNLTFEVYIENTKNNVTVGKASLVISNLESGTISDYRLYIENGEQVFQYDEYGNPPNSKKLKDPLVVLPIKAKLFNPRNIEITDTNFRTRWFFPIEESMIQYSTTQAKNDPITGRARIFEGSEISFEIADKYNPSAIDNNILCEVTLGEKTFLGTTNFLFTKIGENGTNGTDMVAKIEPVSDSPILDEQPVTIYTQPKVTSSESDEGDIITKESAFNFGTQWKDELVITPDALKVRLFQKSQEVNLDNVKRIRWNIAGNTSTGTNKNGRYIVINNSDLVWSNNPKYNLPQKLFQSVVKAEIQYNEDETYYAFYTLPYIEYEDKAPLLRKNRIGIKNSSYLKEIIYNSDGRNPIYNHNQGLELLNIPEDCYIEWTACGGMTAEDKWIHVWKQKTAPEREESEENTTEENTSSEEKTPTEQDISDGFTPDDQGFLPPYSEDWKDLWMKVYVKETEYYEDENARPTFKLLAEKDGDKKTADLKIVPKEVYNEEGEIINIVYPENKVYVLPDDSISGNITNNYIKAAIKKKDGSDIIATVYAPISFSLNTFGLASVNAWDGNSITLDDENGAILAPQVAAGKKNDNNQFTGVVMGVTNDYSANEAEHLTGLFGYSGGLRSFFLDSETGRATFGLPNTKAYENDINGNKILIPNYNKVKHWNAEKQKYEEIEDYNEGQIILDPGGQSVIGGWRIGRQVLYYTTDDEGGLQDIDEGSSYNDGWAKRAQHRRDIGRTHKGILLNAAPLPYISIKGKPLSVGEGSDFDIDSSSGNAEMLNGDSLELNLDPNQKDFFTLFVHHMEKEGDKEKWTRRPLVGIDPAGRFYSNSVKDKETSLTMNNVAGFGANSYNKKYVGLLVDYTENGQQKPIFKAFRSTGSAEGNDVQPDTDLDTTFISGGLLNNEYARPISVHGREISLHSSNSSKLKGTNSEFILKDGELTAKLISSPNQRTKTNIKFSKSENNNEENNVITTAGNLHINVGFSAYKDEDGEERFTAGKPFFLNTSSQTILAKGIYNFTSTTGGIKITSNGAGNIEIKKEVETDKSIIQMNTSSIHSIIAENSGEKAYLKLNKTSASQLKTPENLEISSDKRVLATGYGSRSASQAEGLDFGDFYGILLKATSSGDDYDSRNDVMLGLGPYNPVRGGSDNVYSTPFYVNAGITVGQIYIAHTTYSNVTEPAWTRFCINGMDAEISGGLEVMRNHHGSENGIYAHQSIKTDANVWAAGKITARDFYGDGIHVTNTADWNGPKSYPSLNLNWGGSVYFTVPDISENNGRPNIGTQGITINMPNQNEVWNAISDKVADAIREALYDGDNKAKFLERGVQHRLKVVPGEGGKPVIVNKVENGVATEVSNPNHYCIDD